MRAASENPDDRIERKHMKVGWIGAGRMGFEMAKRLALGEIAVVPAATGTQRRSPEDTGRPPSRERHEVMVWNRTRAKAEPLAQYGAKIADTLPDLAGCDVVFCMVSTWKDVKHVVAGADGLLSKGRAPRIVVECSSISLEGSAELREILAAKDCALLAAPVSGNAKVIKAGKLSFVCSGPKAVFDEVQPLLRTIAPAASWVGEGELARIVKICHNVFLGVVTQSLAEITILAQKAGVPRHAFLDFKVTFTPALLRKDMDLGLDAGRAYNVPMPLASLTRDLIQSMMGNGMTEQDFATLIVQQARASGLTLEPENVPVDDGMS
jgi:3-hydroxyisobutyrate dehydrogenase-like beta-hydroxyacid dehydrogenase